MRTRSPTAVAFIPRRGQFQNSGARRHDVRRIQRILPGAPRHQLRDSWGGSHVWKVGGKVFAIGGWQDDEPSFTFKFSEISNEMLKAQPGLRPAPYLASRGLKWIQHFERPGLSDDELRDYIRQSHVIVSWGLSKKQQIELGLGTP